MKLTDKGQPGPNRQGGVADFTDADSRQEKQQNCRKQGFADGDRRGIIHQRGRRIVVQNDLSTKKCRIKLELFMYFNPYLILHYIIYLYRAVLGWSLSQFDKECK